MNEPLLQVKDLHVHYHTDRGVVRAVDGVSFDLTPGERLGLVGESGSGKATIAWALIRLIRPPGRVAGGQILLDGRDLTTLSDEEIRTVRATRISLIPQGAMNSLNPVMRVKDQIIDSMKDHSLGLSQQEMERRMYQVLERVDLRREVARMYPHQLSGGMKQRVCVAIAICMQPDIIIADEPTSALDVVVQRQVMETIGRLQKELGVAVILIGHDMGLMAQFVDRLAVMYRGRLVEIGPVREVFKDPLHPYTQLLIGSLPSLEHKGAYQGGRGQLAALQQISMREIPALREVRPGRWVALPAS